MTNNREQPQTRSQKLAQIAFSRIEESVQKNGGKVLPEEYARFARRFPALVQSCGLIQSMLFAKKKAGDIGCYLADFQKTLAASGCKTSEEEVRKLSCAEYIRTSRFALEAATWLKRYAEAFDKDALETED